MLIRNGLASSDEGDFVRRRWLLAPLEGDWAGPPAGLGPRVGGPKMRFVNDGRYPLPVPLCEESVCARCRLRLAASSLPRHSTGGSPRLRRVAVFPHRTVVGV